jgi:hypothetical protein
MNKIYQFISILLCLALTTIACEALSGGTGGNGDILFQDDFSNSDTGWDQFSNENGSTDYEMDGYRIYVSTDSYDLWANPGENFSDVRIEVDAQKIGGPDDNDFGLICRSEDTFNFYYAVISSDGYYGIFRMMDDGAEQIQEEYMLESDSINQGGTSNHIRFDCVGDSLTLFVNGDKVNEVTDSGLTSGDVGLIAGTFDTPGTDILFDNYVVRNP